MDLTDAERTKGAKAIDAILSDGYELAKDNRNFIRWMTTSSLAILAFFMTILLQIRAKTDLPLKQVAIIAFASLLFSILVGFYARIRFETKNWFSKLTGMITSSATILRMALDQSQKAQHLTAEDAKLAAQSLDDFTGKIELVHTQLSKVNPARIIIVQGILLILGVCTISVYVFYYLFVFSGLPRTPY